MVVHACDPSTWVVEAGEPGVASQRRLDCGTLSQKVTLLTVKTPEGW